MDMIQEVCENMASFLECFGEIKYETEIIMVVPKEDPDAKNKNSAAAAAAAKKMFS
jgi:hypothetical protein